MKLVKYKNEHYARFHQWGTELSLTNSEGNFYSYTVAIIEIEKSDKYESGQIISVEPDEIRFLTFDETMKFEHEQNTKF